MRKRTPAQKPPKVEPRQDKNIIRQTRRYKLITPLFGGGAEPQKPDAVTIVRGSEIRGQLRFWWRAIRGSQFSSLEEMRRFEEAVWGSAATAKKSGPSPVSLVIEEWKQGNEWKEVTIQKWNKTQRRKVPTNVHIAHPSSPYSYVAFPLREERDRGRIKKPAGSLWRDVEFTINITLDLTKELKVDDKLINLEREVQAALWAWETFGGVGARTRRGFGALQVIAINETPVPTPSQNEIIATFNKWLPQAANKKEWLQKPIPHLSRNMLFTITDPFSDAEDAWKYLFTSLRNFRQSRNKSNRFKNRPGRSKWPEADEIRRLTKTHHDDHPPQHPVDKFPRGRFGLPINFQFMHDDVKAGDPPPTVLQSKTSDRFASRLILRPLICQQGAVGLAVILEGPKDPPDNYVLASKHASFHVQVKLDEKDAQNIEPLKGEPDVLKAFLETL